jgi:hypothetical protein
MEVSMKRISILALVFFTSFVLAPWQKAQAQRVHEPKIITFDVPDAGTGPGQGTTPAFVDARGVVVGYYVDAANVNHGFLRDPDGTIITFDAPGAGTGASQGTVPQQSNPAGAITGMYFDANCLYHGFVRDPDGTFISFEVPEAGTVGGTCTTSIWWLVMKGTSAQNINATGTISGNYTDPTGVGHIFLRAPDGAFTTVDAPVAGTGEVQGTWTAGPNNLNPAGAIIGWSVDSGNALHAFLRTARGKVTTFDARGAGTGAIQGTVPLSLNPENAITGFYLDGHSVFHGFVRWPFGKLTAFDVPGGGTGFFQGTYPANINALGEVAGYYTDTNNVSHGFVRAPWGMLTTFDVPGAGAGAYQGTFPWVNNLWGVIAGSYVDAKSLSHGFVRIP